MTHRSRIVAYGRKYGKYGLTVSSYHSHTDSSSGQVVHPVEIKAGTELSPSSAHPEEQFQTSEEQRHSAPAPFSLLNLIGL